MPEITLPPTHNKRTPAQWSIITPHVDFKGKTVLDLGCGYADLLWRCWATGAKSITGIDGNPDILSTNRAIMHAQAILFHHVDINNVVCGSGEGLLSSYDIVLCFSVLPYLSDIPGTLKWIRANSHTALIECQLYGDGPGPKHLKTLGDLAALFRAAGWTEIQILGTTYIPDRDRHRTIWLCENKELP